MLQQSGAAHSLRAVVFCSRYMRCSDSSNLRGIPIHSMGAAMSVLDCHKQVPSELPSVPVYSLPTNREVHALCFEVTGTRVYTQGQLSGVKDRALEARARDVDLSAQVHSTTWRTTRISLPGRVLSDSSDSILTHECGSCRLVSL